MTHMRLWAAATIIVFIVLIGFILSVPRSRNVAHAPGVESTATSIPPVALRDSYKKGVHTISGSVTVPNACTQVEATSTLVGDDSNSQSIVVAIKLTDADGVCLQVPTPTKFSTTISAPSGLPITVTVNGSSATTTAL